MRDDQGGGRVAEDRDQHLREGAGVAAGEVRDGQDRYAGQAQAETGDSAGAEAFGVAEEAG
ncbi:hypothetical protein OG219_14505 [Streptomyces sp. NBC_00038]|nr:hypothetical protein [Streptomyces sp. NBC_00038]MCX5557223.1 hypothetical protein [Streptomyces sp. NBC_00038]